MGAVSASSANASDPIATIATGSSLALLQRDTATPTRTVQIPSSTVNTAAVEASGGNCSKWHLMAMLLRGIGSDPPESNYGGWGNMFFFIQQNGNEPNNKAKGT